MTRYKKPQTRIKRVKDHNGIRYYAQYRQVIIPHLWREWYNIRSNFDDKDFTLTLDSAKSLITWFLDRDKHRWASAIERKERKRRIKKKVEFIEYP